MLNLFRDSAWQPYRLLKVVWLLFVSFRFSPFTYSFPPSPITSFLLHLLTSVQLALLLQFCLFSPSSSFFLYLSPSPPCHNKPTIGGGLLALSHQTQFWEAFYDTSNTNTHTPSSCYNRASSYWQILTDILLFKTGF